VLFVACRSWGSGRSRSGSFRSAWGEQDEEDLLEDIKDELVFERRRRVAAEEMVHFLNIDDAQKLARP
jgi:hypothetical protein